MGAASVTTHPFLVHFLHYGAALTIRSRPGNRASPASAPLDPMLKHTPEPTPDTGDATRESDLLLRLVFEGSPVGIGITELEGTIVLANPALEQVLGYGAAELRGRSIADVTHPDDVPVVMATLHELVLGQRERFRIEVRLLRSDDSVIWTRATGSLGRAPSGEPRYIGMTIMDITQEKEDGEQLGVLLRQEREAWGAAERRAREEAALRQAAEAISAHFSVPAVVHQIAQSAPTATNADSAFVEQVDIARREVEVVAAWGDLVPQLRARSPYRGSLAEAVIEHGAHEVLVTVEDSTPLPAGLAQRCHGWSALVISLVDAGKAVGALVLLRRPERSTFRPDELSRAHTFANLAALALGKAHLLEDSEAKRTELERIAASRNHLIRGFTHDVKNPLGVADGYLQLLGQELYGNLTARQQEIAGKIRGALRSALELIDRLLDIARAEAGQLEIKREPLDLRQLIQDLVEVYYSQAEMAGLDLHLKLPQDRPIFESDVNRVRQVLGNLISNAIKHTQGPGRITVELSIEADHLATRHDLPAVQRWVAVTVHNPGPGIPADQLERIFEEFVRLGPTESDGLGLGLPISRQVARALGGDLVAISEAGHGSTFTLLLPFAPPAA